MNLTILLLMNDLKERKEIYFEIQTLNPYFGSISNHCYRKTEFVFLRTKIMVWNNI